MQADQSASPTHNAINISDATFEQEVLQAPGFVLVDTWADWCPPCKLIAPVIEKLATEHMAAIKVTKLDVDANPMTQQKYMIRSIPTMLLFKDGKLLHPMAGMMDPSKSLIGYMPYEELLARLEKYGVSFNKAAEMPLAA